MKVTIEILESMAS